MLEEFENMSKDSKKENFIENPVNSFLLLKLLTNGLDNIIKTLNTTKKLNGKYFLNR